jgi:hypothetical protein
MVASASRLDWQHSQDALRDEVGRVTALLRSIRDPGAAPVVGQWNLAEVALHLSQVWRGIPEMVRGDGSGVDELRPERAGVAGKSGSSLFQVGLVIKCVWFRRGGLTRGWLFRWLRDCP